jgi:hypothetical protein
MNIDTNRVSQSWDIDVTDQELRDRLTELLRKARQAPPIFDDDDVEAAIEEAADQLVQDH